MIHPFLSLFKIFCAASLAFLICPLVSFGQSEPPSNIKQQEWEEIASYSSRGLTPLYMAAGKECLRVLKANTRWAVLPRPISEVKLSLDAKPCFRMSNGGGKYDFENAIPWAAEQDWDGEFKLILKVRCLAWQDDELVLSDMSFLNGDKWRHYKPLGQSFHWKFRRPILARAAQGSWWWASRKGIFRIEKGTLKRIEINDWEGLSPDAVVSDEKGRVVAWSSEVAGEPPDTSGQFSKFKHPHYAQVAFFDLKQWHTIKLPRIGLWTSACIRDDGSFVLAGAGHHIVVPPLNAENLRQVEAELDSANRKGSVESERNHLVLGHIKVGNTWCRRQTDFYLEPGGGRSDTSFGMNLEGEMLFSVSEDSDDSHRGFVRIDKNNKATWIDQPSRDVRTSKLALKRYKTGVQKEDDKRIISMVPRRKFRIVAKHDGSFVLLDPKGGLYSLSSDSSKLSKLAETAQEDQILGCDCEGRVYFRRGEAILVFSPSAKPSPATSVREHFELISNAPPDVQPRVYPTSHSAQTQLGATIDSAGALIAIGVGPVRREKNGFEWNGDGARLKYLRIGDAHPKRVPATRIKLWADGQLRLGHRDMREADLADANSVWPGRKGWSLVLCKDQRAALINPETKAVIVEQSLLDLAINQHTKMLSVAPLQSSDRRYNLLSRQYRRRSDGPAFTAAPWLAIGKSIWVSTPKHVYRVEKALPDESELDAAGEAKIEKDPALNIADVVIKRVGGGGAEMLGPIASGELILMPKPDKKERFPTRESRASSWWVVEKPSENGDVVLVGSLDGDASFNEMTKSVMSGKVSGHWFLDSKRMLWVEQGGDRVIRVESARKSAMIGLTGNVHFEDSVGAIWGYHSSGVLPGYERVNGADKNSVRETYLRHLTPLAVVDENVICLTPTGLAKIRVDPKSPESIAIVDSTKVQWPGKIKSCLGITDGQIWFAMQHSFNDEYFDVLASVPLKRWGRKNMFFQRPVIEK